MSFSPLSRRLFLRQAAVSSAAVGLAGCGGISALAPPAPQVYELTPKSTFDPSLPKVTWQLLVDLPSANAGIVGVKPHLAGSASGLGGSLQIGGGAAMAVLAGALITPQSGPYPLLWVMLFSSLGGIAATLWVIRVSQREGKA